MTVTARNSFPEQALQNGGLDLLPVLPGRSPLGAVKILDVRRASLKRLQPHPVLRADNETLLAYTARYAEETAGEPFNPSNYIEYLGERGLPVSDTPVNAVKVTTLLAKWSGKLQKNLGSKGLDGQWLVLKDGLTFAPNARAARIHALAESMVKQHRAQPNRSAAEIRESVWRTDEVVEAPATATPVTLKPESELTRKERKVLKYISELAVSHAAKYPSEEKLVEVYSEQSFMYPEDVKSIIGELVTQKFLFPGRSGGKPMVTTNENVALASLQPAKARKAKEARAVERRLDAKMASDIVEVLVDAGASEDVFTVQKLWAMLQAKGGVVVNGETPTIAEATRIKKTARALAEKGVLVAANFPIQTKDPSRASGREIFKIGLAPELVDRLAQIDPADHTEHVKQLVA